MRTLSIIIPLYNEAPNLAELMRRLPDAVDALPDTACEFVFVDDHSLDDTFVLLQKFAADDPRIRLLRLARNCGSHTAIFAGLMHATGDVVCVLPADLQTPPEIITDMLAKFDEGYKTVWAYRRSRNGTNGHLFFPQLYYRLMEKVILPGRWNKGADVFLVDRQVVRAIRQHWQADSNLFALIAWLNMQPAAIGYDQAARHAGKSKWSSGAKIKLLFDTIFSFSLLPLRFLLLLGLVLITGGIVYLSALPTMNEGLGHLPAAILLLCSGSLLIMAGIVGEYLWRVARRRANELPFCLEAKIGFPEK